MGQEACCPVLGSFIDAAIDRNGIHIRRSGTCRRIRRDIPATGFLDQIVFGDTASETAHHFQGAFTSSIIGLFDEPARISNPRQPAEGQGGDLTFTMKVDPVLRNYITVKFSGNETSSVSMIHINGEQVGYISNGDYEAINKG